MDRIKEINDKLKEYKESLEVATIVDEIDKLCDLYCHCADHEFDLFILYLLNKYKEDLEKENFNEDTLKYRIKTFEYFYNFLIIFGLKKIYDHFQDKEVKKWID